MEPDKTFTLDELSAASGVNPRTIRYYIQLELLAPPQGQTRAARYSMEHLARLVQIKSLTEQGCSLERVAELLAQSVSDQPAVLKQPRPGEISIRTHIFLAPGVDLVIDSDRARLSAEQLRRLTRILVAAYERHQASHDTEE